VNGFEIPIDARKKNPANVEIDNLYLDMNGIIHPCCHPENKAQPKTEAEMMQAIFDYIDRVFILARPRRLIYLAVDGPAPRAKMNQQRARRFRASKERDEKSSVLKARIESLKLAGRKLVNQNGSTDFDSNSITPGTTFMETLSQYLEYYIADRLNSNPAWSDLVVILSDASVPGEGEHKIMEFIRKQRSCHGHNPNLKHMLYGADADLIMLGLASHEPNFYVLREEFRPPTKKPCDLCNRRGHKSVNCQGLNPSDPDEDQRSGWLPKPIGDGVHFLLVELPIMREYLKHELRPNQGQENPNYIERLIDDWIFLCFFVGNDFLPHLPSLRIREGAVDRLVNIYKGLPRDEGDCYLHRDGYLNMRRLHTLLGTR